MDVAIVGMECLLPGSADAEAWMRADRCALGPIPDGRWPMAPRVDTTPGAEDATTHAIGGFVRTEVPLPDQAPEHLADLDPLNRWVLHTVGHALSQTAHTPDRTALVLANLSLPSSGAVRAIARPYLDALKADPSWLGSADPRDRFMSARPAQLAAEVFGLADSLALDAACASGLYAIKVAIDRLASGSVDTAVAAAVNRADSSYLLMGFSQLRALSPTGVPRPLDQDADGLAVGEGSVAVVLKRLADAERDGDRIHAVIRSGGLSNDGRKGNMLAPSGAGQLRAMRQAWQNAGLSPASLGFVECHATGTRLGDGVELESLHALLDDAPPEHPVAIASAKALVGHTVTVAGLAGLLRAVGAVRDNRIPAATGVQTPHPALESSPHLRICTEPEPFPGSGTRRAAVSAFGFGGTNAHVIVESYDPEDSREPTAPAPSSPRLAVVGIGLHLGAHRGPAALKHWVNGTGTAPAPVQAHRQHALGADMPEGYWVDEVRVDPRRYRIPPIELADLLPQQLLMLDVATDAVAQAGPVTPERTASVVGMGLDLHIAESVLRWALDGDGADGAQVAPPLTAARVQGHLPNFVANRIAAQLDLRGPSFTVSSGPLSGLSALALAARLLATDQADAVVVGAVDLPGHLGAWWASLEVHGPHPIHEGAVGLVVMTEAHAQAIGATVLATLDAPSTERAAATDAPALGAAEGLLQLVRAAATGTGLVEVHGAHGAIGRAQMRPTEAWAISNAAADTQPVLAVPHSGPPLPEPVADWSQGPLPGFAAQPPAMLRLSGPAPTHHAPLPWLLDAPIPPAPSPRPPKQPIVNGDTTPSTAPTAPRSLDPHLHGWLAHLDALAQDMGTSASAMVDAHAQFLQQQAHDTQQLAALAQALERATEALIEGRPLDIAAAIARAPEPPVTAAAPTLAPQARPRQFDRQALLAHAGGPLSACFGPDAADLDAYDPRVRMPMPPLLLCDRVIDIEGTPGTFGPSRIVTEYDIPEGMDWTVDGRPPPCVCVESGQADLFLVSWLGIDAELKGERVYRLLDCDLTFHDARPDPGETLRHDIRIDRFARLGATTLFYFHYDAISTRDGRPILSMRNGCAGFFTPDELATPRGVQYAPPTDRPQAPVPPAIPSAPTALGPDALQALAHGRFAEALGPAFAAADGSRLRLPDSHWRLIHDAPTVTLSGPPVGLGEVVFHQTLRDDDWFNPCHFVGDPCMPGTLMFDGCTQAVALWLLCHGWSAEFPDASFDPLPGCTAKLRCRGQVVPGHQRLTYRATIKAAGVDPTPWAIADVLLEVDGTPVVLAEDVGVHIRGTRIPRAITPPAWPDARKVMEYSVGSAVEAFGPAYLEHDGDAGRCARMPGPPYLTMTRVQSVEGPAGEIAKDRTVEIVWDLPDEAWFWNASPGEGMPFAILLETALQPCGWLTAWQQAGIEGGRDLYFRNLGGTGEQHAEVTPDTGPLTIRATQTRTAASGGMRIVGFETAVFSGDTELYRCTTEFGYFSAAALDNQKGLSLPDAARAQIADWRATATLSPAQDLADHPGLPRDDWRMLHRLTHADEGAGEAGLGWYEAAHDVDPQRWFFHAHFYLDPVMPGSLGLEGLLQLARVAWTRRFGTPPERFATLRTPHRWIYRGQVRQRVNTMTCQLEVVAVDPDRRQLRCNGTVLADGLPIYQFFDFGIEAAHALSSPEPAQPQARPEPVAALLDGFTVDGDTGTGRLRLDPALHPWLDHHRPTVTAAALPMAFAAEIAAEAALQLRPNQRVIGLPVVQADKWIHTGEGPIDVWVVAVAEGDTVAVSLAVHVDNPRFPKLSGPVVHMKAVVALGSDWHPVEEAPEVTPEGGAFDVDAYYAGGHTFHGPTLQAMTALTHQDATGSLATLRTRPDADLLGLNATFVLDPLLLDAATHPMWSGEPTRYNPSIHPNRIAYPIEAADLRFFGPRPEGEVRATLKTVHADNDRLVFDVHLQGEDGPWCAYRWTEAVLDGGPYLGHPASVRQRFLWRSEGCREVQVGRRTADGWEVQLDDVIEPLDGTLWTLSTHPSEREDHWPGESPTQSTACRLAAKSAVLDWLHERTGIVCHPRDIHLLRLRADRFIVVGAPKLTAESFIEHLGPTHVHVALKTTQGAAIAKVIPTGYALPDNR